MKPSGPSPPASSPSSTRWRRRRNRARRSPSRTSAQDVRIRRDLHSEEGGGEGDLALFESGAIMFHIAERHAGLLPDNANARARAITWMFAALNTVGSRTDKAHPSCQITP